MAASINVSYPSQGFISTLFNTQFRTFDRIYLFKFKLDGTTTLKILDISQKFLYKQSISAEELASQYATNLVSDKAQEKGLHQTFLTTVVQTFFQKQPLPFECKSDFPDPTSIEDCKKMAREAIQRYKPKAIADCKRVERFICPITHEILRDPVIDECGHTFEKAAIQEHLKKSHLCPLSRTYIHSLTPNRLIQQTIEECQQQDLIPNFSLFKKENLKLAKSNLDLAQNYLQENECVDALDSYAKAFQYTKSWRHYTGLPLLFKKMGQPEKAILAYLYLAHYQLEDGSTQNAIQTLEMCQQEKKTQHHVDLLLIELYEVTNTPQKALHLAQKTAEALTKEYPGQAIALYRKILTRHPQQFGLYEPLSQLLSSPQEKAHILLKGACHALELAVKDYSTAKNFCEQASKHSNTSFVDDLLSLEPLEQHALQERLTLLATSYEQRNLPHQTLRAYKRLFQLEAKAKYCEKIVAAYQALEKGEQQTLWYTRWLSILMKEENWPTAEHVAQTILERSSGIEKIPLYEILETIYTHWQGHKLEDLWAQLGQAQVNNGQLQAAEKTYRKAYDLFQRFEHAIVLAGILNQQGNISQSVQTYYKASSLALIDGRLEKLDLCVRQVRRLDPQMQYLKTSERMQLLTQKTFLGLSQRLEQAEQKLLQASENQERMTQQLQQSHQNQERLAQELQGTQEEVLLLKEKISLKELEKAEKIARKQKEAEAAKTSFSSLAPISQPIVSLALPAPAFGAAKWNQYFGDIGVEPPLPSDIHQILSSPCPIWEGKRVEETHLLVLVPTAVNGKPLTLKSLGELVQSPKQGHASKYAYLSLGETTDAPAAKSHWVLMSRDVIPGSRAKSCTDQQKLVASYAQKAQAPYEIPRVLDATVAIWTHYVMTADRLYSDNPCTFTSCQEKYNTNWQLVVGGFGAAGLKVHYCYVGGPDMNGVSCSRKL